jgi:hypothetical protein
VLLDENVPHALRRQLSKHDTITAAYAGLAGLKNGALLKAAIEAGFEVVVTGDKTLQYEQSRGSEFFVDIHEAKPQAEGTGPRLGLTAVVAAASRQTLNHKLGKHNRSHLLLSTCVGASNNT